MSFSNGVPGSPNVVTPSANNPSLGGRYQDLINANPYSGAQYTESPWQGLLSMFGIRTGADAWRENMAVQSNEYNAAILQKQYDEEYNNPLNQVNRLRAAGINPDLDGGASVDSGSAAAMPEDPSTPMQSEGSEQKLGQFANFALSAFSSALGMIETIQGIQGKKLQNTLLSIQGENDFNAFARSMSGMFLPETPEPEGIQNFDWQAQALKNAEAFAGKHLPKSMQTKFLDWQKQFWSSAIGDAESYSDFRKRISEERGFAFDSRFMWSEIYEVLSDIVDPFASRAEKIAEQNQKTELAEGKAAESEAEYDAKLFGPEGLNPQTAAAAENAANQHASNVESSLSVVTGTINQVMQNLKKSSQESGLKGALSSIALALISGFYLYTQSGIHPSISRTSKSGTQNYGADSFNNSSSSIRF